MRKKNNKVLLLVFLLSLVLAVSAQDADHGFRTGRYEGTAFNTTAHQGGKAIFEILSVNPSGEVSAHFVASDGLTGEAWLTGTVDASGAMQLSGKLAEFSMAARVVAAGQGTLAATYQLRGPSAQEGTFKVSFRSAVGAVLAPGNPPLMQSTAEQFITAYEIMFDLRLSPDEKNHIEQQMIECWRRNDRAVIDGVIGDARLLGGKNLEEIRGIVGPDYQAVLVEDTRRHPGRNPVMDSLLEAFDRAHPDRIQSTRAKGLADLVGTWKKEDYLRPPNNPITHLPSGPSFEDGGTLSIQPGGQFKFLHVHNHCDPTPGRIGGCCRLDGYTWNGTVGVERGDLAFHIISGGTTHEDSCMPSMNRNAVLSPHTETASWTIRANPAQANATAVCLHLKSGNSGCYTKQ